MIERMLSREFERSRDSGGIWPINSNHRVIVRQLADLYNSCSYREKTLFKAHLYTDKHQQNNQLIPLHLSQSTKSYIIGCYWLLNWQTLTFSDLQEILKSRPTDQNQIEQIQLQINILKFKKNNNVLAYNIMSGDLQQTQDKHFFNSFDKTGKNPLMEYQRSYKRITINSVGYNFDQKIVFIESCEGFAAVITQNFVYILSLKVNSGRTLKFCVDNCIDAKWSSQGLYCLLGDGNVLFIQKQKTLIYKFDSVGFSISKIIQATEIDENYICKRIIVNQEKIVGIFYHKNQSIRIKIQIIYSKLQTQYHHRPLQYILPHIDGDIMYENALMCRGLIVIVACTGKDGKLGKINQYIFGLS